MQVNLNEIFKTGFQTENSYCSTFYFLSLEKLIEFNETKINNLFFRDYDRISIS